MAPYGPRFPAIGLRECLEAAKEHPNYKAAVPEGAGRGVAVGFWFNIGMQSSAEVRIAEDGAVTVMEGSPDIGGSRASMALMAAETLGVPYEQVKAHVGDTESTGFCNVTGGSRTTFATGMAVVRACEDIIAQCRQRAALTWDLDEEQVDWVDGEAVPKPGVNADVKPLSLADIARGAGRTGGPLLGRASLNAQGAGASFSCNFTDTIVDTETGKVDVLSFTAVQDAGRAIHPSYVEGQMQGGAVQGIGWALNEEYIYDDDGVMENPGFLDYRVPVASDMPMIDTGIVEVPNPYHPYGVRGVGETPIVASLAAVSNAVRDQLGFRIPDLPLSPPRVLEAIDAQEAATDPSAKPPTSRPSAASRLVLAVALGWAIGLPSGERARADHDGPHDDDVVVKGKRVDCPDGAICSDQAPEILSVDCWRDLTALPEARMSGTHAEHVARNSVGIDIAVPTGTPIYAAKDGVVDEIKTGLPEGDRTTTTGNYVIINYDDGSAGRYLHLLDVEVEEGWGVAAGDLIGHSNATGSTITGDHLHYDHHEDHDRSDPGDPALEHGACG